MNVSKQELDALTRAIICDVGRAQHKADVAFFLNSKDQMELAGKIISDALLRVIDFRDKYQLPAIIADEPYRKARQEEREKEIKELVDRFASNQSDIERLQQYNNHIQDRLKQLEKENSNAT